MLVRCCLCRPAREHPLGKVHAVARRVCGHHRSFLLQVRLHLSFRCFRAVREHVRDHSDISDSATSALHSVKY